MKNAPTPFRTLWGWPIVLGLLTASGLATALISGIATLVMGLASGFVSAPTMGSLYRTLPASQVAQGSSVLYMLNQLGGSFGVAVVALILSIAAEAVSGFQGVYWFLAAVLTAVLAATWFLPGANPPPETAPDTNAATEAARA